MNAAAVAEVAQAAVAGDMSVVRPGTEFDVDGLKAVAQSKAGISVPRASMAWSLSAVILDPVPAARFNYPQ